jgi:ATP-dependent DNA helicase RecQ
LSNQDGKWLLQDEQGHDVGRLSAAFKHPEGMTCVVARVTAILVRRREDAEEQYQQQLRNDQWELVLPELVFAVKQPEAELC